VILSLETTSSLSSIPNIKKLKGDKTAYRLRIGNYRLGFFFADGVIMLAAFETRKDIYKRFP
jgi:mRNA-degrading endonuclease RelE of RelBE toxin-antitoxin system